MSMPLRKPEYAPPRRKLGKRVKKVRRIKKKKVVVKPDPIVVKFDTRRVRIPFRVIFTVVLIFAGGLGTAFSFAYLMDMRQQIDRQHIAIQQQRDENIAARAAFAQHLSIEEVTHIAQTRLGMGPADASQIVRINVPRQSYVVQSFEPPPRQPQGMWESAVWYIRFWLGV